MSEWKPIESAPRELKRCLLFCPEKVCPTREDDGIVMGRRSDGCAYGAGMSGDWTFTHYMLLPEPPQ